MRIFHNDKYLIIREKEEFHRPESFAVCIKDKNALKNFVDRWLGFKSCENVIIYGYELAKLKSDFVSLFNFVEAAGGVVTNKKNEILFIRRWEMWDLPKGKMEKEENPEATAVREVKEETGLKDLRVDKKLVETFHIYYDDPPFYLKKTHWFAMSTGQEGGLKPQEEEEITEVKWMNRNECKKAFESTYRTLRDMIAPLVC